MSLEKLKQAKRIQKKIREQQEKLHFFEMGKYRASPLENLKTTTAPTKKKTMPKTFPEAF